MVITLFRKVAALVIYATFVFSAYIACPILCEAETATPTPTPTTIPVTIANCACKTLLPINTVEQILYKPENLHGSRGPTLLVQSLRLRIEKKTLQVYDVNCKKVAKFGLYSNDWPYGARYYQKSGAGSKFDVKQLNAAIKKTSKKSEFWVESRNGACISIPNALKRAGTVD